MFKCLLHRDSYEVAKYIDTGHLFIETEPAAPEEQVKVEENEDVDDGNED